MTNHYSFIRSSLEWLFSELFLSDVSLWNQYKFIVFNIFSCNIFYMIYCKILIITQGWTNFFQDDRSYTQNMGGQNQSFFAVPYLTHYILQIVIINSSSKFNTLLISPFKIKVYVKVYLQEFVSIKSFCYEAFAVWLLFWFLN